MKQLLTIIFIAFSLGAFSQDILLQQNVKADTVRPVWGPNLTNFTYGYIGLGFPLNTSEPVNYTKPGLSSAFNIGMRYKRKLTNYLALGLDLGLSTTAYKIKQEEPKTFPNTTVNDKEKIQVSTLASSAFIRINVGRRGNYIGNYLDMGGYAGWNFQKKHKTTNKNEAGEKVRESTTQLKYIENFSYGLITRIGIGRFAIIASYRLSDIFKSSYAMPELPRLVVGAEMGLFK